MTRRRTTPTERAITHALFSVPSLLDPGSAALVYQAVLAGIAPERRERVIGGRTLWTWDPRAAPGPDFGLIDEDCRVVAVVEHKCGAAANCTSWDRIRSRTPFDDPVSRSLSVPPYTRGRHQPAECGNCAGTLHTSRRGSRGWSAGVHQIDFYRWSGQGWVRPLDTGEQVRLTDPGDVLWVLLDRDGRSAHEVFKGAHTASEWQTTGYRQLVPGLLTALEHATAMGAPAEGIQVLQRLIQLVIRHC